VIDDVEGWEVCAAPIHYFPDAEDLLSDLLVEDRRRTAPRLPIKCGRCRRILAEVEFNRQIGQGLVMTGVLVPRKGFRRAGQRTRAPRPYATFVPGIPIEGGDEKNQWRCSCGTRRPWIATGDEVIRAYDKAIHGRAELVFGDNL
jgi:hypothetical protein